MKTKKDNKQDEAPNASSARNCLPRLVSKALPGRVPLYMAPVGLFDFHGTLCVKTEYSTNGRPDAYVVDSGEYFWGGTSTPENANNLQVMPLLFDTARGDFEPMTKRKSKHYRKYSV